MQLVRSRRVYTKISVNIKMIYVCMCIFERDCSVRRREKRFYCSCHSLLRRRGETKKKSRGQSATCALKLIRYKAQAQASWNENPEQNKEETHINDEMKGEREREKESERNFILHSNATPKLERAKCSID